MTEKNVSLPFHLIGFTSTTKITKNHRLYLFLLFFFLSNNLIIEIL